MPAWRCDQVLGSSKAGTTTGLRRRSGMPSGRSNKRGRLRRNQSCSSRRISRWGGSARDAQWRSGRRSNQRQSSLTRTKIHLTGKVSPHRTREFGSIGRSRIAAGGFGRARGPRCRPRAATSSAATHHRIAATSGRDSQRGGHGQQWELRQYGHRVRGCPRGPTSLCGGRPGEQLGKKWFLQASLTHSKDKGLHYFINVPSLKEVTRIHHAQMNEYSEDASQVWTDYRKDQRVNEDIPRRHLKLSGPNSVVNKLLL